MTYNHPQPSLRLLLVDTRNTCRSYIAQEMFVQFFEHIPAAFHIATAGIHATAAQKATDAAVKALKDYQISITLPDFQATPLQALASEAVFDIAIALDTTVDKRHDKEAPLQPSEVLKQDYRHLYKKLVIWTGVEPYTYIHSQEKEKKYTEAVEKLLRKVRTFTAKWLKAQQFPVDKIMLHTGMSKHDIQAL